MQLLLLLAAATALVSVVAQEEQADPWTATGVRCALPSQPD
jgi:hypothetical protein